MKFGLTLFLYIVFGYVLSLFFPWWSVVLLAIVLGVAIILPAWASFLAGFLGVALLWGGYAAWLDSQNASILSQKIGDLFRLTNSSLLIYATGLIGGLLGGLGALVGTFGREMVSSPPKSKNQKRRVRK